MLKKNCKIIYIANIRLPTEKAHGIQIMNTCHALAVNGAEVELIVPRRENQISENAYKYYGITDNFKIIYLDTLIVKDYYNKRLVFLINSLYFNLLLLAKYWREDVIIYSRETLSSVLFGLIGKRAFFESHVGGWRYFYRYFFNKLTGVICITNNLKEFYIDKRLSKEKIVVAPDSVNIDLFTNLIGKEAVRRKYNISHDAKVVMYVGSFLLYSWKGVDLFIEASKKCPEYVFVAIGGDKDDIECLSKGMTQKNVILLEKVSNAEVPALLKSADVLVLPNKKGNIISEKFTSPMKLFEYMASGIPIVASDLPSIREVLDRSNSLMFDANNVDNMCEQIKKLVDNNDLAQRLSEKAYHDVKKFSWNQRAAIILNFIRKQ